MSKYKVASALFGFFFLFLFSWSWFVLCGFVCLVWFKPVEEQALFVFKGMYLCSFYKNTLDLGLITKRNKSFQLRSCKKFRSSSSRRKSFPATKENSCKRERRNLKQGTV